MKTLASLAVAGAVALGIASILAPAAVMGLIAFDLLAHSTPQSQRFASRAAADVQEIAAASLALRRLDAFTFARASRTD